jgi:hypothetical protein
MDQRLTACFVPGKLTLCFGGVLNTVSAVLYAPIGRNAPQMCVPIPLMCQIGAYQCRINAPFHSSHLDLPRHSRASSITVGSALLDRQQIQYSQLPIRLKQRLGEG